MNIDLITQYILSIVPAFTAIVGMIVALGVGIGKIKRANKETNDGVNKISKDNRELKDDIRNLIKQNKDLKKENADLKASFEKIAARMEHLYYVEKDTKDKE